VRDQDGAAGKAQLGGERARRRQRRAGVQPPAKNRLAKMIVDLSVEELRVVDPDEHLSPLASAPPQPPPDHPRSLGRVVPSPAPFLVVYQTTGTLATFPTRRPRHECAGREAHRL